MMVSCFGHYEMTVRGEKPMSGVQGNFRVPSILTAEKFAELDRRYSVLCLHDRGVLLVADEQDGTLLTYHAFKKLYGTLGALFLASDRKRIYMNVFDFERARAERRNRDGARA